MNKTRIESDSMGQVRVPVDALYGASTARAVENFPVSGWRMPREFLAALGAVKQAAAIAHRQAGRLDKSVADAIIDAAQELIDGDLDAHFPVDVFQTGSGTSTNMNANEVLANRATQLLAERGRDVRVHPNDDVNRGQSSNDVIPTVMHVAAADCIHHTLVPALRTLRDTLETKAHETDDVVKVGRTHLNDAVPVRLGQEFAGYAATIEDTLSMLGTAVGWLCELPMGGTAVGTGLNAPPGFAAAACDVLENRYSLPFRETENHFGLQGGKEVAVHVSGALRTVAIALGRIASDLRLMGSGPRCGLGELHLPAVQPGSSIMPGKVNPVICESVVQVACQVIGCDAAITAGATGGVGSFLELNVAMPMIAVNLLTAIRLLTGAADVLEARCLHRLEPDRQRCNELVERSLAIVTALAPRIGYDAAAEIAHEAHRTGRTIRETCRQRGILSDAQLDELLNPDSQTRPEA